MDRLPIRDFSYDALDDNQAKTATRHNLGKASLPLIRPQAGMFSICRLIRRPLPFACFSISASKRPAKTLNVIGERSCALRRLGRFRILGYTWRTNA